MTVQEPTWRWDNIQVYAIDLPLNRPLKTASHTISRRELLVLGITLDADGQTTRGYGDISLLDGWTNIDRQDCVGILSSLSQRLSINPVTCEGRLSLGPIFDELHLPAPIAFGLQVALCDAMARHHDLPLWRWLNPDASSSTVPLQFTLGDASLEETQSAVEDAIARGFDCIKLKIGSRSRDADLGRIQAIREAHPDLMIRLDANCAYSLEEARELIGQLAPLNIDLIEEPLRRQEWATITSLVEASPIAIAADERLQTLPQGRRLIADRKADRLVLKPAAICPYVAPWEQQEGLDSVILSSLIESAIGRHALAHLAASHPQIKGPQGLGTGAWMAADLHPNNDPIVDGAFHLSEAPGLGFEPRWPRGEEPVDLTASTNPWSAFLSASHAPDDRLAFSFDGQDTTYGEWRKDAATLALHLRHAHGVDRGDVVALAAPNGAHWPVAALAVWWLGATLVPIPPDQPQSRIVSLSSRAGAQLLIDEPRLTTLIASSRSMGQDASLPAPFPFDDTDRLTLLFTSGSTGEPRAVPATVQNHRASAFASAQRLQNHRGDHWLCCLSMGHIGGLAILLRSLFYGTSFALQRRFEPRGVIEALRDSRPPVTCLSLVPTMLHRLLAQQTDPIDHHLRSILVGGGPIQTDLMRRARRRGWPVLPTYGMTEACSQLTTLAPGETGLHSAGRPLPGVELRLDDDGVVAVRGPMISAAHSDDQGWLITGDVAHLDDQSRLVIDHRQSARIVSGGKNVDPTRVESALQDHQAVERAVVIGLDDPEWGQQVAAAITVAPGQPTPDLDELSAATGDLAAFEIPRRMAVLDTFPTTATGKLCRQTLRAQWPEDRITPPKSGAFMSDPARCKTAPPPETTGPETTTDPRFPNIGPRPDGERKVVCFGDVPIGGQHQIVIAGPCAVESRPLTTEAARAVATGGAHILRGGAFKPRTSPYSFQGKGMEGLEILADAARQAGLPFVTEVLSPEHVEAMAPQVDAFQIGARNMQNFPLLKAVGATSTPVLLKRNFGATLTEWLHAAEYIANGGNDQIVLCERGIRSFGDETRFTLDIAGALWARAHSRLPVIADPSHAVGLPSLIPDAARAAIAAGLDGIMVEVHPAPSRALCDAKQALTPPSFEALIDSLRTLGNLRTLR